MTQTGRGTVDRLARWLEQRPFILPLLILVLGAAFRYYNLNWDSGETLHPDERWVFEVVSGAGGNPPISWPTSLAQFFDVRPTGGSPLNPHFFAYGTLPFYLLALTAGTISTLGQHIPMLTQWAGVDTYGGLPLLGRGLSATLDLLSVLLLFFLGKRVYGYWTGTLAMLLGACTVLDIQLSHFYAVDTVLLPLCLLALLAAVTIARADRRSAYVWGGVALGAGLATKTTALLLVVPLGSAAVLAAACTNPWPDHPSLASAVLTQYRVVAPRLNRNLQWLLVSYALAALTFAILEPYAILDRAQLVSDIGQQTTFLVTNNPPFEVPYTIQYAGTIPYLYQLKNILFWDMGIPLGLVAILGTVFVFYKNARQIHPDQAVLLLWVLPYFLFVGSFFAKFSRYMLPITPIMALFGAALLAWLIRHAWQSLRPGVYAILAAVVGMSLLYSLAYMNIYQHTNTRVAASQWIYAHVPPHTTIAVEGAWDDVLPLPIGATSPTSEGYNEPGLDLYDPDGPQKAQKIGATLAGAKWLVMSSERMVGSIPKLPDRYAMTMHYYHLLMDGKLGYRLVRVFQQHPQLGPVVVHDYGADESFHVYDHPIVRIFKRVRILPASRIASLIMGTAGVASNPPAATITPDRRLMLTSAQWQADRQGRTLDQMFPPGGFAMQHPILVWLLLLEVLGLLAFPVTFLMFRNLVDRGYGLAKTIGLLTWGYVIWIAVSTGVAGYHQTLIVIALAVLALAGMLFGWRQRQQIAEFCRLEWRRVLTGEAVFLAGFAIFLLLRLWYPDLGHQFSPVSPANAGDGRMGEKQMELAFLNAIARSHVFPPYDPFFAHGYINYYYYGFFLVASLCKLTEIVPATGFNLAIATFFAMLAGNTFSVGLSLTRRVGPGVVAALAVGLIGNLAGAWQVIQALVSVSPLHSSFPLAGGVVDAVTGAVAAISGHAALPPFDFWAPTRIIPPSGVISEFPFFTYLFADLHPHLMAYPMTVAVLAFAVNLMLGGTGGVVRTGMTLLAGAMVVGAVAVTNPWDYPTYLGVVAVGALVGSFALRRRIGVRSLTRPALWAGGLAAISALLYLPFKESYQTVFVSGLGLVRDVTPQVLQSSGLCPAGVTDCPQLVHDALVTPLGIYLEHFGALLFPILSYLVYLLLVTAGAGPRLHRLLTLAQFTLYYRDRPGRVLRAVRVARRLRGSVEPVVDPSVVAGLTILVVGLMLLNYPLLAFLAATAGLIMLLLLQLGKTLPAPQLFLLTLLLVPLGLSIATQIVFVKDWLATGPMFRMNTIFKFYNQIWVLYAVAAATSLYYFVRLASGPGWERNSLLRLRRPRTRHEPAFDATFALEPAAQLRALPAASGNAVSTTAAFQGALPLESPKAAPSSIPAPLTRMKPAHWWQGPIEIAEQFPRWTAGLVLLTAASLVYTFSGTVARETYRETWLTESSVPWTLDGMAFMKVAYPDDYAGISWLNAHVRGAPVIAEAGGAYYNWMSRVSMFTGLPDIINGIHEGEQRYGDEIGPRMADLNTLYNSPNVTAAWTIIRRYHVRYIYVGMAERKCTQELCYSRSGLAKFPGMVGHGLSVAFQHGVTTIYRVNRP